eukprot:GHRQ01036604.1.p2 GENE.GHRQ01036604.1~~GHRQ01036604.1.p2  ORF type:complete len:126 (-),score=11.27 GHRQ01036604.1:114-491(-)
MTVPQEVAGGITLSRRRAAQVCLCCVHVQIVATPTACKKPPLHGSHTLRVPEELQQPVHGQKYGHVSRVSPSQQNGSAHYAAVQSPQRTPALCLHRCPRRTLTASSAAKACAWPRAKPSLKPPSW